MLYVLEKTLVGGRQERTLNEIGDASHVMAVVVVSHNTRDHLDACLRSVAAERPGSLVVVDNASADGSPDLVRAAHPTARLLANAHNPGYGAAANQAVRACAEPYVLLLNGDCRLAPGALDALADYLDRHPRAALAGPRLVYPDGRPQPSCYPYPGSLTWAFDNDDFGSLARWLPGQRERWLRTWSHDRPRVVPWVKGAALALRRTAFEAVGGFDKAYFLYFEETDLCYRLAAAGWEVHFAPVTTVTHVEGASTGQRPAEREVLLFESLMRFYRRHYSPLRFMLLRHVMRAVTFGRLLQAKRCLRSKRDPAERDQALRAIEGKRRILARDSQRGS